MRHGSRTPGPAISPCTAAPIDLPPMPYKIVCVGQSGVGKTAYISRLKSKNPKRFKLSKEEPIRALAKATAFEKIARAI
eukprot:SAG11_NODE_2536_length_3245_cov_3.417673_4_plen_79_part_00